MALTVVGLNHRGASLEIRERLAYRASEIIPALTAIVEESGVREAVLLSTCNRTELYLVEGDTDAATTAWSALSQRLGEDASQYGYTRRDKETVAHLFRVASGLDSM